MFYVLTVKTPNNYVNVRNNVVLLDNDIQKYDWINKDELKI